MVLEVSANYGEKGMVEQRSSHHNGQEAEGRRERERMPSLAANLHFSLYPICSPSLWDAATYIQEESSL
jgi:hypothetical protein